MTNDNCSTTRNDYLFLLNIFYLNNPVSDPEGSFGVRWRGTVGSENVLLQAEPRLAPFFHQQNGVQPFGEPNTKNVFKL